MFLVIPVPRERSVRAAIHDPKWIRGQGSGEEVSRLFAAGPVGCNGFAGALPKQTRRDNEKEELLQYSLPEFHIRKIEEVEKEVEIRLSIDAHGVRLDILTSDDKGRYIDVEMQMKDEKNIPHRMRYYESAIDQINLERGMDYTELGDMIIMFITTFDPFQNRGLYRYTFRTLCLEDRELEMQDGVTKVVLNADGREGEISTELKGFLQLVAGSTNCTVLLIMCYSGFRINEY